jgi:hypothetical protein
MKLSEDWLATIIGLAIVVLVWVSLMPELSWPIFGFLK